MGLRRRHSKRRHLNLVSKEETKLKQNGVFKMENENRFIKNQLETKRNSAGRCPHNLHLEREKKIKIIFGQWAKIIQNKIKFSSATTGWGNFPQKTLKFHYSPKMNSMTQSHSYRVTQTHTHNSFQWWKIKMIDDAKIETSTWTFFIWFFFNWLFNLTNTHTHTHILNDSLSFNILSGKFSLENFRTKLTKKIFTWMLFFSIINCGK